MRITEKEAKFLFCPLLTTGDGKMRFCQAAQCMMWRWGEAGEGEPAGFCGLAGAPLAAARRAMAPPFGGRPPKKDADDPFA